RSPPASSTPVPSACRISSAFSPRAASRCAMSEDMRAATGTRVTAETIGRLAWDKQQGLLPAIVQDADDLRVLMLGYMSREALRKTLACGQVTFFSRGRQRLWTKGEDSGHLLELVRIETDCDADTLLVQARPRG